MIALFAAAGSAQTFEEFPVGAGAIGGIVAGPDGNLWFTETTANRIGRMSVSGDVAEFPIPTPDAAPGRIASGPDGNLWFTEPSAGAIARTTIEGRVTEFHVPGMELFGTPARIAAGPDGNVWYTLTISRVGRVTPDGVFEEYSTGYDGLSGITAGPDGAMWFTTGAGDESKICRISVSGQILQFGKYGELRWPTEIVAGPDGNLWFTEYTGGIGRITTGGTITRFGVGTEAPPLAIATWNDGNVWFGNKDEIFSVTPSGKVLHRFPLPAGATSVIALTRGPDGNLWFVEESGTIGRLSFQRRRSALH